MKIACIYNANRGQYVAAGLSKYADVVDIDLCNKKIPAPTKIIAAMTSFHLDKRLWRNDYIRHPLVFQYFKDLCREHVLSRNITGVDAVLQFGLMFPHDQEVFNNVPSFIYGDGVYDPNNQFWFSPRFAKSFERMQKRMYESASLAFTFSDWARNQLNARYGIPTSKIVTCGWGPCLPAPPEKLKKTGNPRRFIFIGSCSDLKGFDVLIGAFKAVKKQFPDVTLDVVGAKEEARFKEDGVRFHGFCDKNAVIGFLKTNDVFVLPSRYDRSSHAIVEAMSYGLPVIVTDTCGSPEPVGSGNCGYVATPGSVEALTEAMLRMLLDPRQFSILSENAANAAAESWNWDFVCKKIFHNIAAQVGTK